MPTITLEEAQARLPELIEKLHPGEEMLITKDDHPVARIVGERCLTGKRRLGTLKYAEDFDAPLEDFKEYME